MAKRIEIDLAGARYCPDFLDRPAQEALADALRDVVRKAPMNRYTTPGGKAMSVAMTSAGTFGWVSDGTGYRYDPAHVSGVAWPAIPAALLEIWRVLVPAARQPDSCLVNFYGPDAKMGMHRDDTEQDFGQPVVSISLGDEGLFRIGGPARSGKTQSVWLRSGDVVVLEGAARLAYHGVDRIKPGSSTLLDKPGRINVTLRVAR